MMNIYDLQERAEVLRKRYLFASVTPEEVGGLIADTLEFVAVLERNASSLGIIKVYNSFDEMKADTSPMVGDKELHAGQLVSIYNGINTNDAHNGEIYASEGKTWRLVSNLASIALGTSPFQAYPGEKGKALEVSLKEELSLRCTEMQV